MEFRGRRKLKATEAEKKNNDTERKEDNRIAAVRNCGEVSKKKKIEDHLPIIVESSFLVKREMVPMFFNLGLYQLPTLLLKNVIKTTSPTTWTTFEKQPILTQAECSHAYCFFFFQLQEV